MSLQMSFSLYYDKTHKFSSVQNNKIRRNNPRNPPTNHKVYNCSFLAMIINYHDDDNHYHRSLARCFFHTLHLMPKCDVNFIRYCKAMFFAVNDAYGFILSILFSWFSSSQQFFFVPEYYFTFTVFQKHKS